MMPSQQTELLELANNPHFKREVEHDAREGCYEDCLYYVKQGKEYFLRYTNNCVLHYFKNGLLIENRTPRSQIDNLQKFSFYNNCGNLVLEVNNYSENAENDKPYSPPNASHALKIKVFDNYVAVEQRTFEGKLICATAYDLQTGETTDLVKNEKGVQLSFDI